MKIELTNQQPQIAVAIKRTSVSMDNLVDVMNKICTKLMDYLAELGIKPSGTPYCAYTNCNEDFSLFDIEWGIPVDEPVKVQGEFFMSQTFEGKAITAIHKGAYASLEAAYEELMDYANENSLKLTGVYYDYYISNPADTPESELLTQLVFGIK